MVMQQVVVDLLVYTVRWNIR